MMFRNNVSFLGRITRDLEVKSVGDDNCVLNFSIAINRVPKKDSDHPEADFIPITAWGKTAENIAKYFAKGDRIGITGRLQSRSYEDKDTGKKRTALDVIAEDFEFIERKDQSDEAQTAKPAKNVPAGSDDDFPY